MRADTACCVMPSSRPAAPRLPPRDTATNTSMAAKSGMRGLRTTTQRYGSHNMALWDGPWHAEDADDTYARPVPYCRARLVSNTRIHNNAPSSSGLAPARRKPATSVVRPIADSATVMRKTERVLSPA